MEKISLKIRGHELRGDVLDDHAMLFFSLAYTDSAKRLADQGKEEEALKVFISEYEDRLGNAEDQEAEAIAINTEIAHRIRRTIRYNWEMRRMVCWELTKMFKDIPKEMVYWNNENDWDIKLEMAELIEITIAIIATAFSQIQKNEQGEERTEVKPVNSLPPVNSQSGQPFNRKKKKNFNRIANV